MSASEQDLHDRYLDHRSFGRGNRTIDHISRRETKFEKLGVGGVVGGEFALDFLQEGQEEREG